ncbi:predicted protein [Naegleria gruberi]|uniref:Predicted protein n=1 Tax=Naegleria gruberi TaxID=5762 RepID=D2VKI3_NAEGR|nr:uncharacterized protein NAEGRDRAFT_69403 [Naegleria gruberi]EFC42696.1 predicted protein [Naegleria gruberi]|eukprot:XP_002675440.1 predicted protein [Naegleria gruberi strain NEG-M]
MIGPQPHPSATPTSLKRTITQSGSGSISQSSKKRKQSVAASSNSQPSQSGGSRITLEKIIGLTTDSNSKLSVHPQTKYVAYCSANVVVCYNPRKNKQYQFLQNSSSNKTFSCLQFSRNGKLLAAGEKGSKPSIVIWDVLTGKKTIELKKDNHSYGITSLAFSNDAKYIVSVGDENDGTIKLWDLSANMNQSVNASTLSSASSQKGSLVHTIKNIRKTNDVAFSHDGAFFVTVGDKFVKYHQIEQQPNGSMEVKTSRCILGNFKESNFVSVDIVKHKDGSTGVYTVNSDGILCLLNENRQILKWLDMKVKAAFSLSVNEDIICCGCANGTVRLFEPTSLKFKCTLPKPPLTTGMSYSNDINCVACRLLDSRQVCAVYSDRSFFIWDISNLQRIAKYRSFLSHSDSIWDIDLFPENNSLLPHGSFVTCSSDNTVRVWNVEASTSLTEKIERGESFISKNVFCKDLLHAIEDKPSNPNGEQGIRSVRFSEDGNLIGCGSRQGVLKIFQTTNFSIEYSEVAHDSEILSMDFSVNPEDSTDILFATSSRDRLIHIFQYKNSLFKLVTSLDDHTASVTSVRFTKDENFRYLISCSADKSIVFRKIERDPNGEYTFRRYQNSQSNGTIFDLDVSKTNEIVSVGQDKKISVWELDKCKSKQSFKVDTRSTADSYLPSAEPIRVCCDYSGEFAVISSADKYIRLYNLQTGECLSRVCGHSEIITGVKFSKDSKRIISVSGDGCIFVWRLSPNITKLLNKNKPFESILPKNLMPESPQHTVELSTRDTLLPLWAKQKKTKTSDEINAILNSVESKPQNSKWLDRADEKEFKLAAIEDETSSNDEADDPVEEDVVYFNTEQSPDFLVRAANKVSQDKLVQESDDEDEKTAVIKLEMEPPEKPKVQEDFLMKNFESLSAPFEAPLGDGRISVTSQFLKKAIGQPSKQPPKPLPKTNHLPPLQPSSTQSSSTASSSTTINNHSIPTTTTTTASSNQPTLPSNDLTTSRINLTESIPNMSDIPLTLVLKLNQISHSFTHALSIIDHMDNSENKDVEAINKSKEAIAKLLQNMSATFSSKAWQINAASTKDILEKYSDMLIDMMKQKLDHK